MTFHFKFVITVSELDIDPRPSFHSADYLQSWQLPDTPTVQGSFQAELEAYRDLRNRIEHKGVGVCFCQFGDFIRRHKKQ